VFASVFRIRDKKEEFGLKRYAIVTRIGAGVMFIVVWGLAGSPLSGVVFLLAMTALSAVRYRLAPYRWLCFAEAALCVGYAFLWLPALLGLWFPVISLLEGRWEALEKELLSKATEDRGERLKLEISHESSAREMQNAARLAEMAERSRIAQDIHDHVGHEISGASIALQTAIKLYDKNDEHAKELLEQSAKRLEAAYVHLREAVHNLKPARTPGIQMLTDLCEDFNFCEARFISSGDFSNTFQWHLLAANLKELLTNVSRHSNATQVTVRLDVNRDYLMMKVTDNGETAKTPKMGLGLSGMRDRVRAAGGTLTVSTEKGFTVATILPNQNKSELTEISYQ